MRTNSGYRFGLQFQVLSDAHRQVGEFLESLGNKKSEMVVAALTEFLAAHPEMLNRDNPVRALAVYGYSEDALNAKIEAVVRNLAGENSLDVPAAIADSVVTDEPQDDGANALDALLDGLDRFV